MPKIINKDQYIFAGASGSSGILGQFGSMKLGTKLYTSNIDTIQSLDAYGAGLNSALINYSPPTIQEFNSLCFMLSRQIAYIQQRGIPEWNSSTTYFKGSIVSTVSTPNAYSSVQNRDPSNFSAWYISLTDNNINNDLSDTNNWMIFFDTKMKAIYPPSNSNYDYTVTYDAFNFYVYSAYSVEVTTIIPYPTSLNAGRKLNFSVSASIGSFHFRTPQVDGNYGYIDNVTNYEVYPQSGSYPSVFSLISDGSKWWMFGGRNITHSRNNG